MSPYWEWVEKYGLSDTHKEIIKLAGSGKIVLELGCSSGYISRELKKRKNVVWGIEKDEVAASKAKSFTDRIIVGDIEDKRIWKIVDKNIFGVIILADIVEHLRNPQEVIKRCKKVLSPKGQMIFSIPNVAHWTIRKQLFFGKFEYTGGGILDRTHLHFYTIKSFSELLKRNNLVIEERKYIPSILPFEHHIGRIGLIKRIYKVLKQVLVMKFPGLFAFQIIFIASKS